MDSENLYQATIDLTKCVDRILENIMQQVSCIDHIDVRALYEEITRNRILVAKIALEAYNRTSNHLDTFDA